MMKEPTVDHLEAVNRLQCRASKFAGQSDPLIRAVLPPVPLDWATPADLEEWREMVVGLTDTPWTSMPGLPIAVLQYARAVVDTMKVG